MVNSLLATKFYVPPAHARQVLRPRLTGKLFAGLDCRLTLLSAPAGFGKSTLLAEFSTQVGPFVTWLSLDEGDNDLARFLSYLIAALQKFNAGLGESVQAALKVTPLPSVEAVLTPLINETAAAFGEAGDSPLPHFLVLDDYHAIHNTMVHQAVAFFLDHLPPALRLVIATREDPPLPLGRWRGRGQLAELREQDLRFTRGEAAAFLNGAMGLALTPEELDALEARTEGWIAGLNLAALSLQGREDAHAFVEAFAGNDRFVVDYLVEEVLSRQPEEIQSFLLRTSMLERLNASICEALVADLHLEHTSQQILEKLEVNNLFIISLDNRREWYRYHHLFADLLRHRLKQASPQLYEDLHRRAGRWYQDAGLVGEAVAHYFAIPDYSLAADLAEQHVLRMVGGSRITVYQEWIRRIPDALILKRPYLCVGAGWAYSLTWQPDPAEQYVRAGEAALPGFQPLFAAPENRLITAEEVRGHLTAIRAHCARIRGDHAASIEHCKRALVELPAQVYTVRCIVALILGQLQYLDNGELETARPALIEAYQMARQSGENPYAAVYALGLLGNVDAAQGRQKDALDCYTRAIELGVEGGRKESSHPQPCAAPISALATIHYLSDDLETAAIEADQGMQLANQAGNLETRVEIALLQARMSLTRGDLSGAEAQVNQASQLFRSSDPFGQLPSALVALRSELCLAREDPSAALHGLETRGFRLQDTVANTALPPAHLLEYLVLAKALRAQGRDQEACALLSKVASAADGMRNVIVSIESRLVHALACWDLGKRQEAFELLNEALVPGSIERCGAAVLEPGRAHATAAARQPEPRGLCLRRPPGHAVHHPQPGSAGQPAHQEPAFQACSRI